MANYIIEYLEILSERVSDFEMEIDCLISDWDDGENPT